jgi:retron-type reverse transcriptase
LDEKGKAQRNRALRLNTDTKHYGGAVCSSDEVSVMEMERRDGIRQLKYKSNCSNRMRNMRVTKPFNIPKQLFVTAYKLIKANAGTAEVDDQSLQDFGKDLKKNLYKLWNRMSSGSYISPAVKAVSILKKTGGERILGVPTVGDRICQMVVKQVLEAQVEKIFLPDAYGYRPNKSALDAIEIIRQRCWRYDWVLEFDIKGLFDNLSVKRNRNLIQFFLNTQSKSDTVRIIFFTI